MDPVLKAGIAHFWFVTIHPFEDGNGRIARAIADMALARADGTKDRFYSMSSQIEAERKDYYLELESAQRGDVDITGWLDWFLGCLDRAIGGADQTLGAVLNKARLWQRINRRPVNERQRIGHQPDAERLRGIPLDLEVREARQVLDGYRPARHPRTAGARHPGAELRRRSKHELPARRAGACLRLSDGGGAADGI